jgi:hypothetical protein
MIDEGFLAMLRDRFSEGDRRMTRIEEKLDVGDARMTRLEQKIDELPSAMGAEMARQINVCKRHHKDIPWKRIGAAIGTIIAGIITAILASN